MEVVSLRPIMKKKKKTAGVFGCVIYKAALLYQLTFSNTFIVPK